MTILRDPKDYESIRRSGEIVREVFKVLERMLDVGLTNSDLNIRAEEVIFDLGAKPAFKGYRGYPASICTSVNEVVVHGIPSEDVVLREGDIISIDIGVEKNGFFADSARTFFLGDLPGRTMSLINTTRECLRQGIARAVAGGRVGDISAAIQATAESGGFEEVRTFVGHGIGEKLHEDPEIPNWGNFGEGQLLKKGMVLAIEPMLNEGTREVEILDDNWTAVTKDGKLSAHFEHTIIVGEEKPEIIT